MAELRSLGVTAGCVGVHGLQRCPEGFFYEPALLVL